MGSIREGLDKFQITFNVSGAGIIGLNSYIVKSESVLRVIADGADISNVVKVRGKVGVQSVFEDIATITGPNSALVDIHTWDFIQFETTIYGFVPFRLVAAGFLPVSPIATPQQLP